MITLFELNQERLVDYNKLVYITPPRAEQAIPKTLLNIWESQKWIAQVKKNGTNTVIFVAPDKSLTFMGRHGNMLKAWQPTKDSSEIFKQLPDNSWYVINAELMNNKTKNVKNTFYIFDILVSNNKYLLGTTYAQRYKLLMDLFLKTDSKQEKSHFILNDNAWLARNIRNGFLKTFSSLNGDEDEGLVIKNPCGLLTVKDNHEWMIKCRRKVENKSYRF